MEPELSCERTARLRLVSAGAEISRLGLVAPGEGNLSIRIGSDVMLISPSGADKGRMDTNDLLVARIDEEQLPAGASCESLMHRSIYRRHSGIRAVVHAHPKAVVQLAADGSVPDAHRLVEAEQFLGVVGLVERFQSGSLELGVAVAQALDSGFSCVMMDHGAVTIGETMVEALRRMLLLDRLAQMQVTGGL
ncbi:MAG: class II aldolase/adducin family protein [bacterium]|nr:class II aldolase/adducin family protein [bacterium]